jgi:hypothetical protein
MMVFVLFPLFQRSVAMCRDLENERELEEESEIRDEYRDRGRPISISEAHSIRIRRSRGLPDNGGIRGFLSGIFPGFTNED